MAGDTNEYVPLITNVVPQASKDFAAEEEMLNRLQLFSALHTLVITDISHSKFEQTTLVLLTKTTSLVLLRNICLALATLVIILSNFVNSKYYLDSIPPKEYLNSIECFIITLVRACTMVRISSRTIVCHINIS